MIQSAHRWQRTQSLTSVPEPLMEQVEELDRRAWELVRCNSNSGYESGESPSLQLAIAIGQVREDMQLFCRGLDGNLRAHQQQDGTPVPRLWAALALLVARYSALSGNTRCRQMQLDFSRRSDQGRYVACRQRVAVVRKKGKR